LYYYVPKERLNITLDPSGAIAKICIFLFELIKGLINIFRTIDRFAVYVGNNSSDGNSILVKKPPLRTFVTTTPELILKYCFCCSVSGAKLTPSLA
jgi:hypothetical protein